MLFVLVWTIIPLYWAVNISLQTNVQGSAKPSNYLPPTPSLSNYIALLLGSGETAQAMRQGFVNSILECLCATLLTTVLATLAAYAFARMRFRGRTVLFYAVLATLALPAYTTLIPVYQLMSAVGLVNTYVGIILVYCSGFLPLATWILHNYMTALPISIEEACEADGATRMQVLWFVVLPLARPGIASTALITFLFGWGQFLFPLILSTDASTAPLTVVIAALQGRHSFPFTMMSAAGVVAVLLPALIALVANKYIVNGMLAGSVK
ncbi:carbohydrate ABC transporter permease [Amnibacterium sp. CER49]|uniref:carbohydrate ABC transporter permease n=1 Tax=Amnibacterium sp. CER49 TaxID=3039161 RepID=UPI00244C0EC8|nr:carbohydrate ABC transporter permease [Amnibacterium sp. CER49]MDH2443217.1 carbohydrate ABC transporter permease [Amnibacterium sp. CER49]